MKQFKSGDQVIVDPFKNGHYKDVVFEFKRCEGRMAVIRCLKHGTYFDVCIGMNCILDFNQPKKEESKMSIEERMSELTEALKENTQAVRTLQGMVNNGVLSKTDADAQQSLDLDDTYGEEVAEPEATAPPKRSGKKKTSKKKTTAKKTQNKPKPSTTGTTPEQVREVLVQLDKESAKAVLKSFDCAKLSDLDASTYDEVIAEAQEYLDTPEAADEDDMLA